MLSGLLIFGSLLLLVFSLATSYNRLVGTTERTTRAWSELETLLRQRHDELPRLIEACEPHLQGAQATFDRVLAARDAIIEARQQRDAEALSRAEGALRRELDALVTRATATPELGTTPAFALLRQRHATLRSEIDERRALYNEAVTLHNAALRRPLGIIAALLGGFRPLHTLDAGSVADAR